MKDKLKMTDKQKAEIKKFGELNINWRDSYTPKQVKKMEKMMKPKNKK